MVTRELEGKLPKTSFFLFGPRQVGKSTLLAKEPAVLRIDLLDPEARLAYVKTPKLLASQVAALDADGTVIIDEVQRAPELLDVVQQLLGGKRRLRFILSGSSARKLRHGGANLLGGRALYLSLHPLTARELDADFNLERVLAYGSLPSIWTHLAEGELALAQDLLRAYVVTYIAEEVQAEALVRNLQGFQSFLDVAAAQFAEQVNFTAVARDCHVAYATVRDYYAILEDTLLGFFLRPYLKSARKRMSQQPRFYFFDNGVTRALLGGVRGMPSPLERGRLFEQWFVQEVVRLNDYQRKDFRLYFWRTSHGAEVDLLVERNGIIVCAIECKNKNTLGQADLRGLAAFREVFSGVPCFVVAPVEQRQQIDFALALHPVEMLRWLAALD